MAVEFSVATDFNFLPMNEMIDFLIVYGILKARILKWFSIPFTSGPRFVRTLHHDPCVLVGPIWYGS